MLLFSFIYAQALFGFEGWLENVFLAWNFFTVYNGGIATKLGEKIGREPSSSAVL